MRGLLMRGGGVGPELGPIAPLGDLGLGEGPLCVKQNDWPKKNEEERKKNEDGLGGGVYLGMGGAQRSGQRVHASGARRDRGGLALGCGRQILRWRVLGRHPRGGGLLQRVGPLSGGRALH